MITLLGVLVSLTPRPVSAQWHKSTDWLILCTALIEETWGPDSPLCASANREGRIKATLDQASRVLESLGFASPAISANLDLTGHMDGASAGVQAFQTANHRDPRCEVRYCAWLVYGLPAFGKYWPSDLSLTLNPFRITEDGSPEPGFADAFGLTEIHELFHAVQFGYPGVEAADEEDWIDWIIEGTAVKVMRAVGTTFGLSAAGLAWYRSYDQPLHVPPTDDSTVPAYRSWAYGTWEFFDFLGDHLGSDLGIQYLDHLFTNLASDQINGLEALEGAILHESGRGLYQVFPEFVARRLIYPCYFSTLGEWRTNNEADCNEGPDNEHRFELSFPDTVARLDHTAAPISANGYLVRMEVPEGKQGLLRIRVPLEHDASNLHLIVGGEVRNMSGISGRRNEYSTSLPAGSHDLLVRLANVPLDLSEADLDAGLDLTGDGPAPIEFILTELDARVTVFRSGRAMEYPVPPDRVGASMLFRDLESDTCELLVELPSEDGDLVWLRGSLSPPLSASIYPIVGKTEEGINIWQADVMLGCERGPCSEWGQPFSNRLSYEGWVEILQITDTYVAGEFDTMGRARLGDEEVRLVGTFIAPLSGILGVVGQEGGGLRPDDPCTPSQWAATPDSLGGRGQDPTEVEVPRTSDHPRDSDVSPTEEDEPERDGRAPANGSGANEDPGDAADPAGLPPGDPSSPVEESGGVGDRAPPSTWSLEFLEDRPSVLRSEAQVVEGTGAGTAVRLTSSSYDLTVAVPLFGCTVDPDGELSALERFELTLAHQRWMGSGRTERDQVLFDFTAGDLRLDTADGDVILHLESAEGAVTLRRGGADRGESGRIPDTAGRSLPDLILEVRRGQDAFRCLEPMGLSFVASPIDPG